MYILVGAESDIGNTRETNQDRYFAKIGNTCHGEVGFFVICDGMGGLSKGEVASSTAVRGFKKWFDSELRTIIDKKFTDDLILKSLVNAVNGVNAEIIDYGRKISEKVGTTASALLVLQDKYFLAHVGDSRIYRLGKKIEQLTEDHTYVAMRLRNKEITKEEARVDSKRNILTQCIGVKEDINIYTRIGKLYGNERFVLCSDGLYKTVSEEEILRELKKSKTADDEMLHQTALSLINKAKSRNERDNISAIVVVVFREKESLVTKVKRFLGF